MIEVLEMLAFPAGVIFVLWLVMFVVYGGSSIED